MKNEKKPEIIDASGLSAEELVELFKAQLPTDKQDSVHLIDFHKIKSGSIFVPPKELLNES